MNEDETTPEVDETTPEVDEVAADDLTDEELEDVAEGETPEDAHREGEFDDLRDRIESISSRLDELISTVGSLVINGTADVNETVEIPDTDDYDVDDMDFSI